MKKISYIKYNSTDDFLNRYLKLYPDQYKCFDFSKTVYTGIRKQIIVTCPKHGDILTTPFQMLLSKKQHGADGKICTICNRQMNLNIYFNELKEKIISKYPNITFITTSLVYDENKIGNSKLIVELFCNVHKQNIKMQLNTLNRYLIENQNPCCNCNGKIKSRNYSNDEFIRHLKDIYPDKKYDYSKTIYKNWKTKVKIICPLHGIFQRLPQRLEEGRGCPYCKESLLEREIRLFLIKENINFIYQYKNNDILKLKSLDFFLPDYNSAIECQGKQHLNCNSIFNKNNLKIQDIYAYDQKKQKICLKSGIKIFYYTNIIPDIPYFDKLWYDKKELIKAIQNG